MDLSHLSEEENQVLADFSTYYEAENYGAALELVETAIEQHPKSSYIWHNQAGALYYTLNQDYITASSHYYQSLEGGFDRDICEDNIWESAEDFFKSMKTETEGFNAVVFKREEEEVEMFRANHFIVKYLETFSDGKFVTQAKVLLEEFEQATE